MSVWHSKVFLKSFHLEQALKEYVLESENEADRLERQSKGPNYDYDRELRHISVPANSQVLDAGCGSGVVSRYLSKRHPSANVVGCDFAAERLDYARRAAGPSANLTFVTCDLTQLPFENARFDIVICRYVLQHLHAGGKNKTALLEIFRVLKPGGKIHVVDSDGLVTNLYPTPASLDEQVKKLRESGPVDLQIGRKLPSMLQAAGFESIDWWMVPFDPRNGGMETEIKLMAERFAAAQPAFVALFGSEENAQRFIEDYLTALGAPGATYSPCIYVASGQKPVSNPLRAVK